MKHLLNTLLMTCLLTAGLGMSMSLQAKDKIKNEELAVRLQKLESLMQNQGLLDLLQTIERLQAEVARLNGELETQNHKLDKFLKSKENDQLILQERISKLEKALAANQDSNIDVPESNNEPALETIAGTNDELDEIIGNSSSDGLTIETTNSSISTEDKKQEVESEEEKATLADANDNNPETETETAVEPDPMANVSESDIRSEYESAFQLLKDAKYDDAIKAFETFQEKFSKSKYGDKAQYWLAETHYVNLDYKNAATEYEKILTLYPDSSKLSHAMLKLGFCYQELGNNSSAAESFIKVVEQFPDTTAAQLATDRLRNLKIDTADSSNS